MSCPCALASYFGTSPEPWNYLLKGMTLLPDSIMGNRDLMQALAEFSEPLVRITDRLVGATNAMRLEAVARDGRRVVLKYAHEDLEVCVGIATAAFAVATLKGDVSKHVPHGGTACCVFVPPPPPADIREEAWGGVGGRCFACLRR